MNFLIFLFFFFFLKKKEIFYVFKIKYIMNNFLQSIYLYINY